MLALFTVSMISRPVFYYKFWCYLMSYLYRNGLFIFNIEQEIST